jgi:transposase
VFRCRASTLDGHLAKLNAEWQAGCRNGAELWRRLRVAGSRGGLRVVTGWTTRRRRSETAGLELPRRTPPARLLSRLMTMQRDQLKANALTVAAIETGVPALAVTRDLLHRFHRMLRGRDAEALAPWLADTEGSLLASPGKGIRADLAAVKAALTEPWSNGQTEGQITKLKLVKRQMYGRESTKSSSYRRTKARGLRPTTIRHRLVASHHAAPLVNALRRRRVCRRAPARRGGAKASGRTLRARFGRAVAG